MIGEDQFRVEVEDPALDLTTDNQVLSASVDPYDSLGFNLKYHMPNADTKGAGVAQGFVVTVTGGITD